MRRGRGLRQHVSEMNVAFMALLCVYAVIRQIIQEGLASSSGTPTFSGGYIQAVYLFCLNRENTGVSLCEPSYR